MVPIYNVITHYTLYYITHYTLYFTVILHSHWMQWNRATCRDMDRYRECRTEGSKSERKKQISYTNTYLETWHRWIYLQDRNPEADRMDMWTQQEQERVGRTERVALEHIQNQMHNRELVAVPHRKLSSVLCDDLEGWDRGWVAGRLRKEGRADSLCCTAEMNTTL